MGDVKSNQPATAFDVIVSAVCKSFTVTRKELMSESRAISFADPRRVLYWLAKRHTNRSLPNIGMMVGYRERNTIVAGIEYIESRMRVDPMMRNQVRALNRLLTEHFRLNQFADSNERSKQEAA